MYILFVGFVFMLTSSNTQAKGTDKGKHSGIDISTVNQDTIKQTTRLVKNKHLISIIENMVFVPGGTYTMGCRLDRPNECREEETPGHLVTVSSFKISKFEVTQAQWRAVMGTNLSHNKGCDSCPVENVSWNDIKIFLIELNKKVSKRYRLPTEAEWEYAARGGNKSNGYFYSGSNHINNVAWYGEENSKWRTHIVGQLDPNELGLYDMTGNVREWCSDWFDESYYRRSIRNNPRGPGHGLYRVVRGGSMYHGFWGYSVARRLWENPAKRNRFIGFRLVEN